MVFIGYNDLMSSSEFPLPNSTRQDPPEYLFELSGGALCLDFTNTIGDRPIRRKEHLNGYDDLLSWARQAQVLTDNEVDQLARHARQRPEEAEEIFSRAVSLRESLYEIFCRLATGTHPLKGDLAVLNRWLAESLSHLSLEEHDNSFLWSWSGSETALEGMLWPVVRSAADLLTSDEVTQVGECASDTCSWLFVDRSRTHRRRWCDMKTCGNRDKARRYYQRKRQNEKARAHSRD
jgi:predicted RNA-binding Zn ribbon-like protein